MKLTNILFIFSAIAYSACSPKTPVSTQKQKVESRVEVSSSSTVGKDGASYENAIKVKNIREEYEWVRKAYPGAKFKRQSLNFVNKKPYDILVFELEDGTSREFYFDISSFYGKF